MHAKHQINGHSPAHCRKRSPNFNESRWQRAFRDYAATQTRTCFDATASGFALVSLARISGDRREHFVLTHSRGA